MNNEKSRLPENDGLIVMKVLRLKWRGKHDTVASAADQSEGEKLVDDILGSGFSKAEPEVQ